MQLEATKWNHEQSGASGADPPCPPSAFRECNGTSPGASCAAAAAPKKAHATPLKALGVDGELKKYKWLDEVDKIATIIKVRDIKTKKTCEFFTCVACFALICFVP